MKFISVLRSVGVAVASTCASLAIAADVIKIIVPAPAGGGTDGFFRVIAREAEPFLGGPVAVVNVGGAGGTMGITQMARAKPDGLTLAAVWSSPVTAAPHTMKSASTPDDYLPVIQVSTAPYVFCVASAFPANDGRGMIDELKKNPAKYTYGNDGVGGTGQLAAERIFRALGVSVRDVPFKGAGETLINFLGGHVDIYVGSISPVMPHVKAGKSKCLLLSSADRVPSLPAASGLRDLGIAGEETLLWRAILAPKGTSPERLAIIENAFEKAVQTPASRKFIDEAGEQVMVRKGAELRSMVSKEYSALGRVVQVLKIGEQK
jgi:tripartite-type tricarboxylate transporter receptor subunit TctC